MTILTRATVALMLISDSSVVREVRNAPRYSASVSCPPFSLMTSVTAANIANISLCRALEGSQLDCEDKVAFNWELSILHLTLIK